MNTVVVLIDYIRKDFKSTIATIANLTSHGEITFDLLYAIMVPRTVLVTTCPVTGEPRALRLISATKIRTMSGALFDLLCESMDAVDDNNAMAGDISAEAEVRRAGGGRAFGKVQNRVIIVGFMGTVKINTLEAYPIKYHANETELRKQLLERGRKWTSLRGVHHMQYKGTAALVSGTGGGMKVIKYNVSLISRVFTPSDVACTGQFEDHGRPGDLPTTTS